MAFLTLTSTVHVCEDINTQFNIIQLLKDAGYTPVGHVNITSVGVEQNGDIVDAPTALVMLPDNQTIEITAANKPNYNGGFSVFTVSVDTGDGSEVVLEIQTIIDPVNDAPSGEDKTIELVNGSGYILSEADFGFKDVVEHDGFKSVYVTSLPHQGTLLLNGSPVAAGTDVSLADIQTGKLSFSPDANSSGQVEFGFQVRDTGGNNDPDCGSSDLDLTPNYITFKVPYASLGDTVFNDDNRNGVQDSGESGVAGVTVTLHGAGADGLFGTADDTTNVKVTDSTGHYQFDQLNAGQYQADFSGIGSDKAFTVKDQGGDDARDSDVDAAGHSSIVTLLAGQTNTTLDAGLVTKLGAIGDYAFLDKNKNGVQDAGDTPFTQIKVTLHGAGADGQFGTADDTTAQQFTDVVGHYQFDNLLAGKYQVEFTNPLASQLSFTTADAGGDDTKDSDINATTGLSQVVNLAAGEINTTVDGGFVFNQGSIGDYVFFDKNGNGVQDAQDTGVAGVTVTLNGAGFDGQFGTADDTLQTTATDSSGHYLFTNVNSFQDYTVTFSGQPSGYAFTARDVGDDTLDSDAFIDGKTDVFTLGIAENKTDIDAGLVAKKGSIGDFVFIDKNGNGVQDAGDTGVAGATVTLKGAGVDGIFGTQDDTTATTTTDANGKYVFKNVAGDQDYQVSVSNTPAGYAFTTQGAGGSTALDSDVNASGTTNTFHLGAGEAKTDIDAGLVEPKGAIGDLVFYDTNRDGLQDANDIGLSDMTVTLAGAGQDGVFGTADDISATTTTDASGKYLFDGLSAGKYQVTFSKSPYEAIADYTLTRAGSDGTIDSDADANGLTQEVTLGVGEINTTLDGGLVLKQASLGDFVFLDKNGNGLQDSGEAGVAGVSVTLTGAGSDAIFGTADDYTATTTTDSNGKYTFAGLEPQQSYQVQFGNLPAGHEFTTSLVGSDNAIDSDAYASGVTQEYVLSAGENLTTVDAGIVAKKGSIGDFVFIDKNGNGVQDAGDVGVAGAKVTLTGAGVDGVFGTADDTTATANTDANGLYTFTNVAGDQDYKVSVSNTPAGYNFTAQGAGGNTALDSDVNASGNSNTFHLGAGETRTDIDAGLVAQAGSIGDFVFIDKNGNGVQDAGDVGIAGAKVTLTGAGVDGVFGTADDTTATANTDANGLYTFTNVAGDQDYKVSVSNTPAGYTFTTQGAGSDRGADSDVNISGVTNTFHLNAGEAKTDIDAGLVANAGSIGDFVFLDKNGNGVQDAGEAGVSGAKVTLTGAGQDGVFGTADDTTATTSTDANGLYSFANVAGDRDYKITVSNTPAGYTFTAQGAGADRTADSDVNSSGVSNAFHLNAGETKTDIDAGLIAPKGAIGDTVFFDRNENGLQDSGEVGVHGVTVTLTSAGNDGVLGTSDDTTQTTTTDANGKYLFSELAAGQYQVGYSNIPSIANYTLDHVGSNTAIDSNASPSTGLTEVINLAAGQVDLTVDGGLVLKHGAIGDLVFLDSNGNGIQDTGEAGVAGVTVSLKGAGLDGTWGTADDVSRTTTTDANGKYLFSELQTDQNYQVTFNNVPAGYEFTQANAGTDRAKDSNAAADGTTAGIYLAPAETNTTIDAGLVGKKGSIGNFVWLDSNGNGLQDATEAGIGGITVKLTGAGNDGTFGTADDTTATTTTSSTGAYLFSGLSAGAYTVAFSGISSTQAFTTKDVGANANDALDSDVDATGKTGTITLGLGENKLTVDAGVISTSKPTACVGDRVWYDDNKNGLQDSCEAGVAGVTVKIIGAGADNVFGTADDTTASTVTDSCGNYKFSGLYSGQQYQLQFGTKTGYGFTTQDVGTNDACDSDAAKTTGLTKVFTLADGECNTSFDAGLVCRPTACVGDRVWNDANKNGLQDNCEAGIAGVTVKLIGAGADGIWGNADDVCLSTTTDCNGAYKFSGLIGEQQYQLQFGTLAGYGRTLLDVGTNDTIDSDANATTGLTKVFTLADGECNTSYDAGLFCRPTACVGDRVWFDANRNGIQDCNEAGASGVTVTLTGAGLDGIWGNADDVCKTTTTDCNGYYKFSGLIGEQQYQLQFGTLTGYNRTAQDVGTNDTIDSDANTATGLTKVFTLADGECNTSFDAGLLCRLTASVGDRVWNDCNNNGVQDAGEGGLACVAVKLTGAGADGVWGNADDVCLTTTTDCNGAYKFSGLTGGQQYQLQFGTLNGYSRSAADVGTNDATDSDANTTTGLTKVFTLADGENNTSFDAGLFCKPTASVGDRVWLDCNGNGIQDAADTGVACITVKLTGAGADGIWGNADDVCKTTTTDSCGYYKFTGLIGDQQYKLQFTNPTGYLFTAQDQGTNNALDSDVNSAGLTNAFTLAAGQNETSIDAGLVKQVTASIVGATSIYEGCSASYQVKLSAAVSTDTWVTVSAIDGTAHRTSTDLSCQNLYGVNAQTNDYALIGTDCKIDADGVISVKIAAGQTCSSNFSLSAWKENVSVDFFTYLCGGYKEAAWENLNLHLSNSTNALVTIGSSDLCVNIGDTTTYSLSSPIALDMDGNGIHTTALIDSKGTFDLLGNGHAVNSGWLSSGDAFLAIDNNSNGKIDSISEMFGGNKGDGFAKLASFDTNHDGLVDAKDADFGKLLVWQDLNGDHATDAGELRTLGEAGIASLNVGFTDGAVNQLGNVLGETSLATRTDGSHITTTDVYFNTDVDGASLPELASLLSSTNTLLDQALGTAQATAHAAPAAPAANDATVTLDAETLRQLAALLEQHAVAA